MCGRRPRARRDIDRERRLGCRLLPVRQQIRVTLLDVSGTSRIRSPPWDIAMGHKEDARRLRTYATFDNFSNDELKRLARAAHHTSTSAPLPLIHEQTPSDACYIILSGEVGVYVGEDRIAVLGPGEVIGESALHRGKLRTATVTTIGPTEVLRIGRDDLATLLQEIPALGELIDASVARHVPVVLPPKPKPRRSKLGAKVQTDLVERFRAGRRQCRLGRRDRARGCAHPVDRTQQHSVAISARRCRLMTTAASGHPRALGQGRPGAGFRHASR